MSAGNLTEKQFSNLFDAFNRHDIEAIMEFFDEDCVFYTVAGEEVYGTRLQGKKAIANAFSAVWTTMPDARWEGHRHFVCGNRAVSEWTFFGTDATGARVEAEGCDLFTQRGGKITRKQAFRKNRPLLTA